MIRWFLLFLCGLTCLAANHKPITIVTCSYNNINYYAKNLSTVLDQDYPNYRVIYIDDCSTDGTGEAVEEFLSNHPKRDIVSLVRNANRQGAMENFWRAIHTCGDEEIIAVVDGDDWLPGSKVLCNINEAYQNPNNWIVYTTYKNYPKNTRGISRPLNPSIVQRRGIRAHPYVLSHMRTFYAGLFKKIKMQDLFYQRNFVPSACDVAMNFPMMEMAYGHIHFLNKFLYIYNNTNPIADRKMHLREQQSVHRYVARLKPYSPLTVHPASKTDSNEDQVDAVVFSYNRPMQLYSLLESFGKRAKNIRSIEVIYRSDNDQYDEGYSIVQDTFKNIIWTKQKNPPSDFKKCVLQAAFNPSSPAKYVVFAVDDIIIKDDIDFSETARLLKKTGAYGFYLRLGQNIQHSYMANKKDPPPKSVIVETGVRAWSFQQGVADWGYPNTVDMTVYRKEDIKAAISRLNFNNPNYLEAFWDKLADRNQLGICYDTSKILNIPMNIVSTFKNKNLHMYTASSLLRKFLSGEKIDIDALYKVNNQSVHANIKPQFVKR